MIEPVISQGHDLDCKQRIAETCAVPVACDHGYDVCPECDPCTCEGRPKHTPKEIADARELIAMGLSGFAPGGEAASDDFDLAFDEALDILYPGLP